MSESTPLTVELARHLARRTGFGAKTKDVDKLMNHSTVGEAVDDILDFTPTKFRPGGKYIEDIHNKWVKYMIKTPLQLQEKLVVFWHDHFATSYDKVGDINLMRNQNRLLRVNCKGNFRDLVKAINKDAAMMEFLDTVRNRKKVPNENYARELMELFTLGVKAPVPDVPNGPDNNYDQADIVQIARAFTGWDYDDSGVAEFELNSSNGTKNSRHDYMADFPTRGPKVIFKSRGGFGAPAGQSFTTNGEGAGEIDAVIDIIFQHQYGPSGSQRNTVADHIATKLITYFAHPSPSAAYVHSVVDGSGFASNWELAPLLRAIFVHDDFFLSAPAPGLASKKSVKWPVDYAISSLRLLGVKLKSKYQYVAGGSYNDIRAQLTNMGQILFQPPSVFGWDWETSWVSSASMIARFTFARDVTAARDGGSTSFRPDKLMDLTDLSDPGDIVDAVLEALGVTDQFTASERTALVDYVSDNGALPSLDLDDYDIRNRKLHGLFATVLQSPAYQLH